MSGQAFKTQTEARVFLNARGFKIGRSAFSNHVSDGLVSANADGVFEEQALLNYAAAHLENKAAQVAQGMLEAKQGEVAANEEVKRKQAEWLDLKLARERGQLMPREDFNREMAARMQFFAGELRQLAQRVAPLLIAAVGGDEARLPKAVRMLDEEMAAAMDAWSADREFVVALPEDINV